MSDASESWRVLLTKLEALRSGIQRSKPALVSTRALRTSARDIGELYFRSVHPHLSGMSSGLTEINDAFQDLIRLATGSNRKTSYTTTLRTIRQAIPQIEVFLATPTAMPSASTETSWAGSGLEQLIIDTLDSLVIAAANSYRQALDDLNDGNRVSYRGTAAELREVVREVLDHLAPDDAVTNATGFKPEKDRSRPTMKQKARFIMRSRMPSGSMDTAEAAVVRVEEASATFARSVYDRGSVSTHIASTRGDVLQLKAYVDSVLAELLEVYRST